MLSACWLIGAYFLGHKRGRLNTSVCHGTLVQLTSSQNQVPIHQWMWVDRLQSIHTGGELKNFRINGALLIHGIINELLGENCM